MDAWEIWTHFKCCCLYVARALFFFFWLVGALNIFCMLVFFCNWMELERFRYGPKKFQYGRRKLQFATRFRSLWLGILFLHTKRKEKISEWKESEKNDAILSTTQTHTHTQQFKIVMIYDIQFRRLLSENLVCSLTFCDVCVVSLQLTTPWTHTHTHKMHIVT